MTGTLEFRPYAPGDEAAITELFQLAFSRPLSLDFWNWRFRDNPIAGPQIELCWHGRTLAGHYAVSPMILHAAGTDFLSALSMTTMTHPGYRGRGIIASLAERLYQRLADQGYELVLGFPNDHSHRVLIRDLGWQDLAEIPMFSLDLSTRRPLGSGNTKLRELREFDGRFDQPWHSALPKAWVAVKRSSRYLQWRYLDHPENQYRVFAREADSRLLAYVVFKTYQNAIDIVDLASLGETPVELELVSSVIAMASDSSVSSSVNMVNIWLPLRCPLHLELEKLGFRNRLPITYAGVRRLGTAAPDFEDGRRWFLTMGDSDVF